MAGDEKLPAQCGHIKTCPASAGFSVTGPRQWGQMSIAKGYSLGVGELLLAKWGECKQNVAGAPK